MSVQGIPASGDTRTASPGLNERLGKLFGELFPAAGDRAVSDEELCRRLIEDPGHDAVESLLDEIAASSRQRGLVTVAHRVLEDFLVQPAFHPELAEALRSREGGVISCALDSRGWLSHRGHPVLRLLEIIAELATGWYPDHVQAEEIRGQMLDWFAGLGDGEKPEQVLDRAARWRERFQARREKLETRLRDREHGALRLQYASREAARVINRQLAGRRLPAEMARDLQRIWLPGLQWILLNESQGSGLWNRAVRTLTLLFWSVQPVEEGDRAREKRRRVTAQVRQELPELLGAIMPEPGLRDRLMEDLQIIWLSLDHGRAVDYVEVPPLETGSLLDEAGASVSRDLLGEIGGVSAEDWFQEYGSGRRFRLLLKQDEYQELMFVDQAGFKIASLSYEDFAWQLTNGSVAPVPRSESPAELVAERLNTLAQQFRDRRREATVRKTRPVTAPVVRERESAQDVSARARKEEARIRRQQALETVPEAEPSTSPADDPRRRKWARLLVSGLTLGTWLVLEVDGVRLQRKLILILSSTDKYVLVGADGTGRRELSRAELIQGVAEGTIVASSDNRYDDTLGRVVEGLQRKNGVA